MNKEKEITLPSGKKVVMKAWISENERRELRSLTDMDDDGKIKDKVAYQDIVIKFLVISLDGDNKNVVDRCKNDIDVGDFDSIVKECINIMNPLGIKKN